jgi:hypothetical protein
VAATKRMGQGISLTRCIGLYLCTNSSRDSAARACQDAAAAATNRRQQAVVGGWGGGVQPTVVA